MGETSQRSDSRGVAGTADARGLLHDPKGLPYLEPLRADAFLGLVRAGETLATDLDAELQPKHGLSLRAFEVLLFLAVFAPDGHMRITELTERAPLSQSRVSRLVGELQARGLVERGPDATDGRAVKVAITDDGLRRFRDAQGTHLASLQARLFSRLDDDEIRQLAAITTKILRGPSRDRPTHS